MTTILIGRAGEALHEFDLDDIKQGAVRDSGLLPELYQSAWPQFTAGALVSGVERKLYEHRLALDSFYFPLYLPPALLPQALEDSKEAEVDHADLVLNKVARGFVTPVRSHAATLKPQARKAFLGDIAARAGAPSIRHLGVIGDDRGQRSDPAFLEALYGGLRDHHNPQVREVFEPGHDVPGKRVKETDGARLGVFNSVYLWHQAVNRLRDAGTEFDSRQYMDTTLCFTTIEAGVLPLPEQGLIVKALGPPRLMRPITEHDVLKLQKGRIFTYDHFDLPMFPGVPEWMTIHDYKRCIADNQSDAEKEKYQGVDRGRVRQYLREIHSPAAAMTAFAHAVGLPLAGNMKRSIRPKRDKKPRTVVSNAHFLTASPKLSDIRKALSLPKGMRPSRLNGGLKDLRGLEVAAYSGQAFVVLDPDKIPIAGESKKSEREIQNIRLLRRLETGLIYSYLITMSTQVAPNHIGRPHLVDKDWYKEFGRWHPDLCNLALTGDVEQEAYWLFKNKSEFRAGLRRHDEDTYQHQVDMPKNDFKTPEQLRETLDIADDQFVVSFYGSASGFADETYTAPRRMTYGLSTLNNLITVNGGGTRSGMLGMQDGPLTALREGFNIHNIGIRSEGDVSPLEGNVEDWIADNGYDPKRDPDNDRLIKFADDQMKVLQFQRILPRQAAIASISHVSVISDGGKGTILELFITVLHNARVNLTGEGLLGHNRIIPLVVLNRDIEQAGIQRGIFDEVLKPWRDHFELMGIQEFTGKDPVPEAMDWVASYGKSQGFDLSPKQPARAATHEWEPA